MLKQWRSLFAVLVCCGASALAQKPLDVPPVSTAPPASTAGPIMLEVVVTDKAGNPIRGLKQEDFTLLDDKQPTVIRSFAAHEIETEKADSQGLFLVIDDVNANFSTVGVVRTQIENFLHSNGGHLPMPTAIFMLTDRGLDQITKVSDEGNELASVLHDKEGQLHD